MNKARDIAAGGTLSDGGDVELLVYLVDEEKDICIGVLALVCLLVSRAQPS